MFIIFISNANAFLKSLSVSKQNIAKFLEKHIVENVNFRILPVVIVEHGIGANVFLFSVEELGYGCFFHM